MKNLMFKFSNRLKLFAFLIPLLFTNSFTKAQTIDIGPPSLQICFNDINTLIFNAEILDVPTSYQINWSIYNLSGGSVIYILSDTSSTSTGVNSTGFITPNNPPSVFQVCASIDIGGGVIIQDCVNVTVNYFVPNFTLSGTSSCGVGGIPDGTFNLNFTDPSTFYSSPGGPNVTFSYVTNPKLAFYINGNLTYNNSPGSVDYTYNMYISDFVEYSIQGNPTILPNFDSELCDSVTVFATVNAGGCTAVQSIDINFVNPTYEPNIVGGPSGQQCGFNHHLVGSHPGCGQQLEWTLNHLDENGNVLNSQLITGNDFSFDFSMLISPITYPAYFSYSFKTTSSATCPLQSDTIMFEVIQEDNPPSISIFGNSTIIWCNESDIDTVQLQYSTDPIGSTIVATSSSLFDVSIDTNTNTITIIPTGSYADYNNSNSITLSIDGGGNCSPSHSIYFVKAASFNEDVDDVVLCSGETIDLVQNVFQIDGDLRTLNVELNSAPPASIQTGFYDVNSSPVFDVPGQYTFSVDIDPNNFFNCPNTIETADFSIFVIDEILVSIADFADGFCSNDSLIPETNYYDGLVQLPDSISNSLNHLWIQTDGPTVSISDTSIAQPIISGFQPGETYSFEYTASSQSGGCSASDEISFTPEFCGCTLEFVSIEIPDCISISEPFDVIFTFNYSGIGGPNFTASFPNFTILNSSSDTVEQGQNTITYSLMTTQCTGEKVLNYNFSIDDEFESCSFEGSDTLNCCSCENPGQYEIVILSNCSQSDYNEDPCTKDTEGNNLGVCLGVSNADGDLLPNSSVEWIFSGTGNSNNFYPGGSGVVIGNIFIDGFYCTSDTIEFECPCIHSYHLAIEQPSGCINNSDPCAYIVDENGNYFYDYIRVTVYDENNNEVTAPTTVEFSNGTNGSSTWWNEGPGTLSATITDYDEDGNIICVSEASITFDCELEDPCEQTYFLIPPSNPCDPYCIVDFNGNPINTNPPFSDYELNIKWYLNGNLVGTGACFSPTTAGLYSVELSVVSTKEFEYLCWIQLGNFYFNTDCSGSNPLADDGRGGRGKRFEITTINNNFSFYPNPLKNQVIQIDYDGEQWLDNAVEYQVLDVNGKTIIKDFMILGERNKIQFSELESGMYFIVLKNNIKEVIAQSIFVTE